MPLYESWCANCETTFERLAPVSAARNRLHCPRCGRRSPRIASAFAIAVGRHRVERSTRSKSSVFEAPPRIPSFARLCGMDDESAARLAAHKAGRGAEYEDKLAAREESRRKLGAPSSTPMN